MQGCESSVIFGAGSVGRGFLGQLLSESGFEIVFIDVNKELVDTLGRRGSYTLRLSGIDKVEELEIGPVRAIEASQTDQVAVEVANASLMATAVGARALQAVATAIAAGLAQRWNSRHFSPLNVIVCENLHDAPDLLEGYVCEELPVEWRSSLKNYVGFVAAVIARMSPVPTPNQLTSDPSLIVAEPYKSLPVDRDAFAGSIPHVIGMDPVSPFTAYVERKLYIHNAAHAMLGYLGYHRRHTFGYEALDDPWVRPLLEQALNESRRALVSEHGFCPQTLKEHVEDLLTRFGNRALADPIDRLCRDPLRKLAPDDRLVGAAQLAERHSILPEGLAWGIAAALAYENPNDNEAVQLRETLSQKGLAGALSSVCGIQEDAPLAALVGSRYRDIVNLQIP